MQKLIIQILLTIGFASCNLENQPNQKCREQPGKDVNRHVKNAVLTLKGCFIANVENFRHNVAQNSCINTTHEIQKCHNDIVMNITACKSSDEQYFPKTIFKVISDYAGFICSNVPKYKIPILLEHKTCFPLLGNGISCFERFRFFNVTNIVSKEEMHSDREDVKECLLKYVNDTCPEDNVFLQIVDDTFHLRDPSSNDGTSAVGSIILLMCSLIVYLEF